MLPRRYAQRLLASSTQIGFRELPEARARARGLTPTDSSLGVGGCPLHERSTTALLLYVSPPAYSSVDDT